jgi:hypothetical protein
MTTCPCHNCLVYIRCKHRIETQKFRKDVYYTFDVLVKECGELRDFFGLNTLLHKAKLKKFNRGHYLYERTLMSYIQDVPRGKQLVEEFLKVMGVNNDELPNSLNPKIRIRGSLKK